ncbi:MAG: hypothetical protein ABWZ02_01190 [Nakamurella sp.]
MTVLLARAAQLIPTPPPDIDPSTGKGPEWGKAAPVGLLVILLLCLATFFLLRSMNRKIKAVPASFDPPAAETPAVGADQAAATGPPSAVPADGDPAVTDQPADPPTGSPAPGLVDERSN